MEFTGGGRRFFVGKLESCRPFEVADEGATSAAFWGELGRFRPGRGIAEVDVGEPKDRGDLQVNGAIVRDGYAIGDPPGRREGAAFHAREILHINDFRLRGGRRKEACHSVFRRGAGEVDGRPGFPGEGARPIKGKPRGAERPGDAGAVRELHGALREFRIKGGEHFAKGIPLAVVAWMRIRSPFHKARKALQESRLGVMKCEERRAAVVIEGGPGDGDFVQRDLPAGIIEERGPPFSAGGARRRERDIGREDDLLAGGDVVAARGDRNREDEGNAQGVFGHSGGT